MPLTRSQADAVEVRNQPRDTCVVAGPGSGKTLVLVERYQRLVAAGIPPGRILAITFTEKAASNMKMRLAVAFSANTELRRQLEQAYVSTVHGFCARLLRENAIFAGIDPEFRVLDARQAAALQARCMADSLDGFFADEPAKMHNLMRALGKPDLADALSEIYEGMRESGMSLQMVRNLPPPGEVKVSHFNERFHWAKAEKTTGLSPSQRAAVEEALESCERFLRAPGLETVAAFRCSLGRMKRSVRLYDLLKGLKDCIEPFERTFLLKHYAAERDTLFELLGRFDVTYRARKQQQGALDYSDLEEETTRLLEENDRVRERVRSQFDQILMDEFQDTNGQQARLLDLLRAPDRFYAVGDINQSIYGFRYANPGVFHAYRAEVGPAGTFELRENWRSRPEILSAVEHVLSGAKGIETRPLIAARSLPEKTAPSVELIEAFAEDLDTALALEAQWVARRICDLAGELRVGENKCPARFGDIAVLVRNSEVLPTFVKAFEDFEIPYLMNRGKGFFETREVLDLTHLLRILSNTRDEISMAAMLRSPFVEVSDEALLRLKLMDNLGSALRRLHHTDTSAFEPADLAKLLRFREQLERWRDDRDVVGFDRLLMRAMDEAGYEWTPGSRGGANIEKFLAMAREAATRLTLSAFVEELELFRSSDAREPDAPPEDSLNAVRVMTVHGAKGLEFPVVFLAAVHKGMDTKTPHLAFSPRHGLGARWLNPVTGEDTGDLFHAAIRQEDTDREMQESNRLLYVAMTRAEEHLVLSLSHSGKTSQNWAAMLQAKLGLDLARGEVYDLALDFPVRVWSVGAPPDLPQRAPAGISPESVPLIPRPSVIDQHDANAAVTSVAIFADCPRKYYLSRYLGWEGTVQWRRHSCLRSLDSATEFGSEVHSLLAESALEPSHADTLKLVEVFRTSELGRRAQRAAVIQREFDFLLAIEDVVLRGQIDLWFEEGGELVLVDYKTDDVDVGAAAERAESYGLQLRLYALALERVLGRLPDKAYVYLLRPNISIAVDLHPLFLHAAEQTVRAFREAQDKLSFPLHEGEHCRRCPYFMGLCPA